MINFHEKQKLILEHLMTNPKGVTAGDLADVIKTSKTAAKEHIDKLERLGHLNFRDEVGPIGRPKRFYFLSTQGQEAFPKQYSWMTSMLLATLAVDLGADKISSTMEKIAEQVATSLEPELNGLSDNKRMAAVVKVMNQLGYMAKLSGDEKNDSWNLEAYNCVYHNVAKEHPSLCAFDIRLLEQTTNKSVKLESCIARGGESCKFCIGKT